MSNYVKYNKTINSSGWASAQVAPFRFSGNSTDSEWYPMIQINLTNAKYILGVYAQNFCGCRILDSQPNTPQWAILSNGDWGNVW